MTQAMTMLAALQLFYPENGGAGGLGDVKASSSELKGEVATSDAGSSSSSSRGASSVPAEPLSSRRELTVHVLGASGLETSLLFAYEELLHSLPALRRLNLVFVGPDAPPATATAPGAPAR